MSVDSRTQTVETHPPRPSGLSRTGLRRASGPAARDLSYLLLGLAALVWAQIYIRGGIAIDAVGFDFLGTVWDAANSIRHGESPFPRPITPEVDVGNPALYPPVLPLLAVPLTLFPWEFGLAIWLVSLVAATGLTLWALGVRDVRCYALAVLSAPVVGDVVIGNATLLLVPLVALAWRWRDTWIRVGCVLGFAIAAKLFLWPLVFWLLGTKRYKAAVATTVAATAFILVPWAAIGFEGITAYPALLRAATDLYGTHSYSVTTVASAMGAGSDSAGYAAPAVGALLAATAFVVGRRRSEVGALSIALLAGVLGSPIVWEYNYAFLLIPLAIARPRFSWPWALLPLFYFTHQLPRPRLLSTELLPGGSACCRPPDVPESVWVFSHAPPGMWPALGHAALGVAIVLVAVWPMVRSRGASAQSQLPSVEERRAS